MKIFTKLASVIFALVSVAHLVRIVMKWQAVVGPFRIPLGVSICGFLVTALLSVMLWRESRK